MMIVMAVITSMITMTSITPVTTVIFKMIMVIADHSIRNPSSVRMSPRAVLIMRSMPITSVIPPPEASKEERHGHNYSRFDYRHGRLGDWNDRYRNRYRHHHT